MAIDSSNDVLNIQICKHRSSSFAKILEETLMGREDCKGADSREYHPSNPDLIWAKLSGERNVTLDHSKLFLIVQYWTQRGSSSIVKILAQLSFTAKPYWNSIVRMILNQTWWRRLSCRGKGRFMWSRGRWLGVRGASVGHLSLGPAVLLLGCSVLSCAFIAIIRSKRSLFGKVYYF